MSWVVRSAGAEGYNTNKAAFWRVIRRISVKINNAADSSQWSSYLCWTNLFKISPSSGGNPSPPLRAAQEEIAAKLLPLEIEAFDPACILVIAGRDWFEPFTPALGITGVEWHDRLVEGIATDQRRRRWVIAKRPERKAGGEDPFVEEIVAAFASA